MKGIALVLAVVSGFLLAEGFSPDFHDPSYRKTTSYIEKGDYLESPQHGSSGLHKHSDKVPHHDDSHSHEDSAEHRRHAREAVEDVETRRGSSHSRRPGSSSLGSGGLHTSSGLGHSSGLGSGSHHGSSGLGHSSGLGSGSHHGSSGLGHSGLGSGGLHTSSGLGHSSGLGSGSHHGSSGLGHSSGLGSGGLHTSSGLGSGSFYQGSGHNRRPSLVRGGTIFFNDSSLSPETTDAPPQDHITLKDDEYTCQYSNVNERVEDRRLECNGQSCFLTGRSDRHTSWKCGTFECNLRNADDYETQSRGKLFECSEKRSLIRAPPRCPPSHKPDRNGKCRPEF